MCFLSKRFLGLGLILLVLALVLNWNWRNPEKNEAVAVAWDSGGQAEFRPNPAALAVWEEYRIERAKSRSEQRQRLQEIMELGGAEAGQQAAAQLLKLTDYQAQEAELENLLLAKGYPDTAVWLDEKGVVLILSQEPQDEAQLRELAARLAKVELEKVSLIF